MDKQAKIAELYKLYEELEQLELAATERLNVAKRSGNNEVELIRDGKPVKIKESVLWYEVFNLGADSEAAAALKAKYPDVFEAYALQNHKADELKEYTMREFKIDYTRIRLSDIFKIVEYVLEARAQ